MNGCNACPAGTWMGGYGSVATGSSIPPCSCQCTGVQSASETALSYACWQWAPRPAVLDTHPPPQQQALLPTCCDPAPNPLPTMCVPLCPLAPLILACRPRQPGPCVQRVPRQHHQLLHQEHRRVLLPHHSLQQAGPAQLAKVGGQAKGRHWTRNGVYPCATCWPATQAVCCSSLRLPSNAPTRLITMLFNTSSALAHHPIAPARIRRCSSQTCSVEPVWCPLGECWEGYGRAQLQIGTKGAATRRPSITCAFTPSSLAGLPSLNAPAAHRRPLL